MSASIGSQSQLRSDVAVQVELLKPSSPQISRLSNYVDLGSNFFPDLLIVIAIGISFQTLSRLRVSPRNTETELERTQVQ